MEKVVGSKLITRTSAKLGKKAEQMNDVYNKRNGLPLRMEQIIRRLSSSSANAKENVEEVVKLLSPEHSSKKLSSQSASPSSVEMQQIIIIIIFINTSIGIIISINNITSIIGVIFEVFLFILVGGRVFVASRRTGPGCKRFPSRSQRPPTREPYLNFPPRWAAPVDPGFVKPKENICT